MRVDAGPMRLALESDDGARLILGDQVLLNLGEHGMQMRYLTMTSATAGWQPLSLEWFNNVSGGGIRLLWQPSGSSTWEPVPAERLAHGPAHQPGLAARFWQLDKGMRPLFEGPRPMDFKRVKDMPWHYRAAGSLGYYLWLANRHPEALPFLRSASKNCLSSSGVRRAYVYSLTITATPAEADELAEAFSHQSCFEGNLENASYVGQRMAAIGSELRLKQLFANRNHGCCVEGLTLGYVAICRADWQQAFAGFTDVQRNRPLDRPQDRFHREHMQILKAIFQRVVTKQEPDWDAWREFSMDSETTAYIRLFAKWYTGQITWEEALARRAATVDGDAILWLHALHCSTVGEHDQAKQDLQEMITAYPTWIESDIGKGLLRWYSRQTPQTLAAQPKAPPLPAKRGTPTPEEKPNF
jgi:hypothetical protein